MRCITFCSGFLNTKLLLLVLLHGWNDPITYGGEHSTQSASPQCPGQKQLPACYYSTLVQSINTLRKHGKTHTLVDSLASRRVLLLFVYRARGHHTPGGLTQADLTFLPASLLNARTHIYKKRQLAVFSDSFAKVLPSLHGSICVCFHKTINK